MRGSTAALSTPLPAWPIEQIERVVELGYDLRGVMYWTLVDNFEWGFGFSMRFGVYKWENDGSQKREARSSLRILRDWYQRLPQRVAELRQGGLKEGQEGKAAVLAAA